MKRIAFFGPVLPIRSGISDYDEELLSLLRKHFEIDVFVPGKPQDKNVFNHSDFDLRHKSQPYDLNLYQMGNSLLHEYVYGYIFRYPGATVFHDYCLHHSRAKMLMLKGLFDEYVEEAKWVHPEEPRLGRSIYGGLAGELLLYYFPFVRLLLQASLAAGAHTDFVVEKLKITDTPVIKIPMAVRADVPDTDSDGLEKELAGLYPGKLAIASFGLVTAEKRLSTVLEALAEIRYYYSNLIYVVVGEESEHYDLRREIQRWGVQDIVEVTGRVDTRTFQLLMARADIIVNLRYPSAREMSATLLRALAWGKPVLMSRLQHLQEIPKDAVIRVRPDHEIDDLFHHLWRLIEYKSLREKLGTRARIYIENCHSPKQMLEKYLELIELALQRKENFKQPVLPLHLRGGSEIMREYIKQTSFSGRESDLLDWIL